MTAVGQTRSFGDVGSMSGLPESGHGLSDLRVRPLISATAPPLRSVATPSPNHSRRVADLRSRRPCRSRKRRAVAEVLAGVGRRRSLARSVSINLKRGAGGRVKSRHVPAGRVRAGPRFLEFATDSRAFSGICSKRVQPVVGGGRGRVTGRTAAVRGGRRSFGRSVTARFRTTVRPPGGRIRVGGGRGRSPEGSPRRPGRP